MAATPKRKHSSARQGKRRSQISLMAQKYVACKNCGKQKIAHFICPHCHQ